ncbi:MAG: hypothetical protein P8Q36_12585 [Alphaproteobacteria bacterium]|jgi:hypothetical protein|nr:hypothetical protein [Rhodospirillaceae bacterium]MDG2481688.1 hypothetical protein [Alphaproteobacteria bacterium]MBT6206275.1 hypothetical protein [Rhodospirillaceae bacterium]MBT6508952.1 hypothetical protein [Rhodospirillaceae bacterium]MBT7614235.1 hypothetical protein [Rhodospirillaceae bacterium]
MAARTTLAEVGEHDGAVLFDIGASAATIDALVMVSDPELTETLRGAQGERLVGTHHPALMALVAASPPRLFRSALVAISVTQPIATEETPHGPHTHLLPDLIDGSTHDRRITVPHGWLPTLTMHIPDDDADFPTLTERFGLAAMASNR